MYVKVKVSPNAKKQALTKIREDTFEIQVKEKADLNQANIRVRELLAEYFETTKGNVRIVNGHHSGSKLVTIHID